ncbi:DUF4153 domain-containing protein [Qipengyuania sp. YG27]|uniref:DUF4153 domain-containing protein n=1 Tax=Qipengyuania mesophila TaxID=2867246 RepID=A0ABS7JWQ3_9SPHN|nr:DUF4153 domain-containing protein [Qipengyuania mesophila]MBX7502084.1 DUF4153 domain-containing protein [Qipengyuania mesophila]
MTDTVAMQHEDWALRPWVLAGLLGLAGLGVHFLAQWDADSWAPWRAALTAAVAFGPLAFAFTLDRARWREPLAFAALVALVMAGIAWRVAAGGEQHADAPFWFAAAVVAIALALPLFQAGFHRLRWRTPYDATHFHVWTDAISAAGALAFTGLSWLLLFLLSQLFAAIEIDLLKELIEKGWFGWTFSGAAFGAALGVLRNQLKVIGTLQSVVMLVFAIIAVPLAIALAIFLAAVLASGISVLWNATQSPTPLLLSVAVASFVLVNAVIRNGEEEASGNRVMRWAALALALAIFPLALLAAISTGTRIAQYGLSPERIWGVIAVAVAVAYGVAYFVAPIRGRMAGWMARVRGANMHLAVGTCVLAFLLALPLFDFGAVSTRNQVERLESGKVAVEEFDFDALRWDFGDAGRRALAQLARSKDAEVAKLAKEAQERQNRPNRWQADDSYKRQARLANLRADIPAGSLRDAVEAEVRDNAWICNKPCVALDLGPSDEGGHTIAFVESGQVSKRVLAAPPVRREEGDSFSVAVQMPEGVDPDPPPQSADSTVEIRDWTGRRIYIDGQPAGEPFE